MQRRHNRVNIGMARIHIGTPIGDTQIGLKIGVNSGSGPADPRSRPENVSVFDTFSGAGLPYWGHPGGTQPVNRSRSRGSLTCRLQISPRGS